MFLVHFNRFETFLLKAMFESFHLQRHWKSYMSWFGVAFLTFLFGKATGLIDAVLIELTNK
jgi:hypothetical protein